MEARINPRRDKSVDATLSIFIGRVIEIKLIPLLVSTYLSNYYIISYKFHIKRKNKYFNKPVYEVHKIDK